MEPRDLLDANAMVRFRPLYDGYLANAERHLAAGKEYIDSLPRGHARVRLACAWPILIGLRTISRLRTSNVLEGGSRIKISRAEVRGLIVSSILRYPFRPLWDSLFREAPR